MSLVSVKQGAHDIPGLTDSSIPNRLGPKRANHIRKFWNLDKKDDVRIYVIRRTVHPRNPDKKLYTKAPKIQQMSKEKAAEYKKFLATRLKQAKQKHREDVKRRHLSLSSTTAKPKGPLEISVDEILEKPGKSIIACKS
ncbi:hypothetical protein NQZ79_g5121 [Umbelopsis isabellina]|nr:hypothetical protein NQZ79_g5121 [Umbelopsis isabellina]